MLSVEARLQSESFEHFIDFLGFRVQMLWPKNNKLTNCLINRLINYSTYDVTHKKNETQNQK